MAPGGSFVNGGLQLGQDMGGDTGTIPRARGWQTTIDKPTSHAGMIHGCQRSSKGPLFLPLRSTARRAASMRTIRAS